MTVAVPVWCLRVKHRRWERFRHSHGLCAVFVLTPHRNPVWKQSHPPVCLSSEEKTADRDCHVLQSPSFRLLEPHWHLCWNLTGSSTWLVHVWLIENHSVCSVLSSLSIFVSLSLPFQQQLLKAKEATDEMELSILKTCQSISDLRREVRFSRQALHRDWIPWAKASKTIFLQRRPLQCFL